MKRFQITDKRQRIRGLWVLMLGACLLLQYSPDAEAGRRGGRGGRGGNSQSRMMQAAKSRMTSMIQQQIEAAKKVLAAAESKANMSQSELQQAMSNLSSIQNEINSAESELREAMKALNETEEEILKSQGRNSELGKAEAALQQAKDASHQIVHEILNLPPDKEDQTSRAGRLADLAKLSASQRQTLDTDARYKAALDKLRDAGKQVDDVKRQLFRANADWNAAQEAVAEAQEKLREERQHAKATGANTSRSKQKVQSAQSVAAAARAVIQQGEARLKMLSRMPSGGSRNSRSRRGR